MADSVEHSSDSRAGRRVRVSREAKQMSKALQRLVGGADIVRHYIPEMDVGVEHSSVGLITVQSGPIRWVNLTTGSDGTTESYRNYYARFGVPDPALARWGNLCPIGDLQVAREQSREGVWPFRRVTGRCWTGDDLGTGLVQRLAGDESLQFRLRDALDPLSIWAHPESAAWTIVMPWRLPTEDLWMGLNAVAHHLIVSTQASGGSTHSLEA